MKTNKSIWLIITVYLILSYVSQFKANFLGLIQGALLLILVALYLINLLKKEN